MNVITIKCQVHAEGEVNPTTHELPFVEGKEGNTLLIAVRYANRKGVTRVTLTPIGEEGELPQANNVAFWFSTLLTLTMESPLIRLLGIMVHPTCDAFSQSYSIATTDGQGANVFLYEDGSLSIFK